jgi:DNA-binding transcriptional regulator LsrR (DeoR family)
MIAKFDVLLMVMVAQMYYMNDMDQEEIAKKLKIPTSQIPGILAEAAEFGIVDIKIRYAV